MAELTKTQTVKIDGDITSTYHFDLTEIRYSTSGESFSVSHADTITTLSEFEQYFVLSNGEFSAHTQGRLSDTGLDGFVDYQSDLAVTIKLLPSFELSVSGNTTITGSQQSSIDVVHTDEGMFELKIDKDGSGGSNLTINAEFNSNTSLEAWTGGNDVIADINSRG